MCRGMFPNSFNIPLISTYSYSFQNTYDFSGKNVTQSANSIPSKSCYFTKAECDNLVASGEKTCALGVFFVWTGTDKDKKVLNSVKSRFGAFPPNRIVSI